MEKKRDHFIASLEGEEFAMEPHCQCGEMLNENYFCEKCKRNCVCLEVYCKNEKTYDYFFELTKANSCFNKFIPLLMEESTGQF